MRERQRERERHKYAGLLDDDVFKKIFGVSELLNMDKVTRNKVLDKMTTERDLRNQIRYATETAVAEAVAKAVATAKAEARAEGKAEGKAVGIAEGKAEGKAEVARNMLAGGMPAEQISLFTGLSICEIEKMAQDFKPQ